MAKEYYIELGVRRRPARYTRQERIDIENRFDCDIRDFVYKKCFPLENGRLMPGGRLECQEALIYYGLRHIKGKITEESIAEELQQYVANGGSIYKPLSEAIVALVASGVMGFVPQLPAEPEDAEGKEEAVGDERGPATVAPIRQKTG